MINAGQILVNGTIVRRAGEQVAPSAAIDAPDVRYVSRGAHKLSGALDDLELSVAAAAFGFDGSTAILIAHATAAAAAAAPHSCAT